MLDEIGAQNNWNIQGYTKSGCTPVPLPSAPPSSDQEGEQKANECQQFVTETSEELKNNENVETIIMAASPTDRKFYDEDGRSSDEIAIEALTEMWQEWDNADKEVIIIGETPHFEELNGPTCIESNYKDIAEACSRPKAEVTEGRGTILTSAATTNASPASFYDPVPGICDDERCYSMVGNLITRYDHHHLSEDFARSFGEDFVRFLRNKPETTS